MHPRTDCDASKLYPEKWDGMAEKTAGKRRKKQAKTRKPQQSERMAHATLKNATLTACETLQKSD
jgi:hypothetical protein